MWCQSRLRYWNLIALCGAVWAACSTPTHADTYKLVVEDKIRLRVLEWRPADSRYDSWEALEGAYTVDPDGGISIPIAGRVNAGGQTTDQLAELIATALSEKAGLPSKPFVALEIAEHAPIYVTGAVETPGRYPFQVNMTVMKAISVSGGFMRLRGEAASFERDQIEAGGDYRSAILKRRDLLMRKARLTAEIAGHTVFETPAELAGITGIETLRQEQLELMRLRRVEMESRIDAARDLTQLYSQEIETLTAKISTQSRQIELSQKELDSVSSLVSKGLTNNARQFSADRGLAEAQSRLLDLEIALTRARQSLSESTREKTDIVNKQNAENRRELNEIELAIRKTAIDLQVAQLRGDLADIGAQISQTEPDAVSTDLSRRSFRIIRRSADGQDINIDASETTALLPHDIIEVGRPGSSRNSSVSAPSKPAVRRLATVMPESLTMSDGTDLKRGQP